MSREERLFDAIGGADESLLERSERIRKWWPGLWLSWGIGLAACLALVLNITRSLPGWIDMADTYSPAQEEPVEDSHVPVPPQDSPPAGEVDVHYLQIRTEWDEPEVQFRISINEEIYYSYEQEGVYIIRPRLEAEELPECRLEIYHMAGTAAEEAAGRIRSGLTALYDQVEILPSPPNGWFEVGEGEAYLCASDGTDWDDAQREVWIRPDGEGGVFVLSSSYFLEATEGHGARFVDMMNTFTLDSDLWQIVWMAQLRYAGERLSEAVFAGDLSSAEDLLAENAEVYRYPEDVSGEVSAASVDYSISGGEPLTAAVSVKHRMGGEEPYRILAMELEYRDGQWIASRVSLEE